MHASWQTILNIFVGVYLVSYYLKRPILQIGNERYLVKIVCSWVALNQTARFECKSFQLQLCLHVFKSVYVISSQRPTIPTYMVIAQMKCIKSSLTNVSVAESIAISSVWNFISFFRWAIAIHYWAVTCIISNLVDTFDSVAHFTMVSISIWLLPNCGGTWQFREPLLSLLSRLRSLSWWCRSHSTHVRRGHVAQCPRASLLYKC